MLYFLLVPHMLLGHIVQTQTRETFLSALSNKMYLIFVHPTLPPDVRLNLLNPDLSPDTKFYQRVRTALTNPLLPKMSMRVAWQPPADSAICPSSVAKYFDEKGYRVRLIQTNRSQHQEYSMEMPLLGKDGDKLNANGFYATPNDIIEYIGMLSLGCNREPSEYLNSYRCHGHSREVGNGTVVQWRGMFTCNTVERLFDMLR